MTDPAPCSPVPRGSTVFALCVSFGCFASAMVAERALAHTGPEQDAVAPTAEVVAACTADYPWREVVARLQPSTAHVCDPHDLPCWQREMDTLETLLAADPGDLNLQLTYQTLHEHWPGPDRPRREKLRRETARALEERPEDARARYLEARAQPPREALAGVEAATRALPESPWPHLDLAVFESLVAESQDPSVADPHLQAFLERCPHPPAWTLMLGHIGMGSDALWREHLPRLRQSVAHMPPFERLQGFYHLWALEGRVLPLEAQAEQRDRPLADLDTLEGAGLETTAAYWVRRREAHGRAEDEAGMLEALRQLAQRQPCSILGIHARNLLWDRDHAEVLTQVQRAALRSQAVPRAPELYAATGTWLGACGDDVQAAQLRFFAALGLSALDPSATESAENTIQLSDTARLSNSALVADAKRWLRLWEARREVADTRAPHSRVARILLDRNLEPAWAVTLLEEYRQILHQERVDNLDHELLSPALQAQRQVGQRVQDLELDLDRLQAATSAGQLDTALAIVRQAARALDEAKAATLSPESRRLRQRVGSLQIRFFERRATLATAQEQPLDAIAFALRAEGLRDARGDGGVAPETVPPSLDAWRQQGGTDAGWQALRATVATTLEVASLEGSSVESYDGWEILDRPLVDFDLEDTEGRRWRRGDLAGRAVLLNVWATWCAPCVEELPVIERLHQRFAGHPDVLVLTLNVDREIGRVGPFMARQKLTVPALLASDLFQRMTTSGESEVPQVWLVDATGTLRQRQRGYVAGDARVFEDGLAQRLEALAADPN